MTTIIIITDGQVEVGRNCRKDSRPLMAFDMSFRPRDGLKLSKCLFPDVFGTPRGHPKSKMLVDQVTGFYYVDVITVSPIVLACRMFWNFLRL